MRIPVSIKSYFRINKEYIWLLDGLYDELEGIEIKVKDLPSCNHKDPQKTLYEKEVHRISVDITILFELINISKKLLFLDKSCVEDNTHLDHVIAPPEPPICTIRKGLEVIAERYVNLRDGSWRGF